MTARDADVRYSRQIRVAEVGTEGQRRLREASILVVGVGATGTHVASSLCRAGVGALALVDRDVVELSNLQRQILFDEADAAAGIPKAIAARDHLTKSNSDCEIEAYVADCSLAFLDRLPNRPDLVLDGTDNFPTRYLLNDWCRKNGVPWIYAGAVGSEGASLVIRSEGPCLRCLWPEAPEAGAAATCETAGILEPTIAAVTAFQTAEAIKLLVGLPTTDGIFTCNVLRGSYQVLAGAATRSPDCPVCHDGRYPALDGPPVSAVTLCGRNAVQVDPPREAPLDLEGLAARVTGAATDVVRTPHLLRFSADGCRFSVFPGGRALLFGIDDPLRARALYDRWIGVR